MCSSYFAWSTSSYRDGKVSLSGILKVLRVEFIAAQILTLEWTLIIIHLFFLSKTREEKFHVFVNKGSRTFQRYLKQSVSCFPLRGLLTSHIIRAQFWCYSTFIRGRHSLGQLCMTLTALSVPSLQNCLRLQCMSLNYTFILPYFFFHHVHTPF